MKSVCFFGGYEDNYPRCEVLRKGLENEGFAVEECRVRHTMKIFNRYPRLLWKYVKMKNNFDIIFVPVFRHKDVPLAWILGRMSGKKIIFDPLVSRYETKIKDKQDAPDRSFQSWYNRRIDSVSLNLPDLVLADTEEHALYYAGEFGVPESRIRVLPVGYDDQVFSAAARHRENGRDSCVILFYGSYLPLHGVDTIINAAAFLRDRHDIRIELIGDGQTCPRVRKLAEQAKLENVKFLPRVSYESLPDYINKADVCLGIFGRSEKALRVVPNKIYQCLAMAKAVITANTAAVSAVFEHERNIILVPPGDPEALAAEIQRLADDADLRGLLGRNGFAAVGDKYSCAGIGKEFKRILEDVFEEEFSKRAGDD